MSTLHTALDFDTTRLGVIMSPKPGEPHEAWGVLNPGGVRAADGTMHLFPRLIAEGNYSRNEPFEVNAGVGAGEDARVVYVPRLKRFVMTYTAFVPYEPRAALAISEDLVTWQRLGVLRYEVDSYEGDFNKCGNEDGAFFPDVIFDPEGVPSFGIFHRSTTRLHFRRYHDGLTVMTPPLSRTGIADMTNLTSVRRHERVMAPMSSWETKKVGTGTPPVRHPLGWILPYHAVSTAGGHPRYSMGIAIRDIERPSHVSYRRPSRVLEPQADFERNGLVSDVVFPSAADLRTDGSLVLWRRGSRHRGGTRRITKSLANRRLAMRRNLLPIFCVRLFRLAFMNLKTDRVDTARKGTFRPALFSDT